MSLRCRILGPPVVLMSLAMLSASLHIYPNEVSEEEDSCSLVVLLWTSALLLSAVRPAPALCALAYGLQPQHIIYSWSGRLKQSAGVLVSAPAGCLPVSFQGLSSLCCRRVDVGLDEKLLLGNRQA